MAWQNRPVTAVRTSRSRPWKWGKRSRSGHSFKQPVVRAGNADVLQDYVSVVVTAHLGRCGSQRRDREDLDSVADRLRVG